MYKQNQVLVDLLQPAVAALGYELLGIEHLPKGKGSLVRLYIDCAAGISLDDCACVSERITGILDVNDPIHGVYELEVSSPGLDRLLFTLEQFQRFIGSRVRIKLCRKLQGRKNIIGVITGVKENTVIIVEDDNEYFIAAENIERARLVY